MMKASEARLIIKEQRLGKVQQWWDMYNGDLFVKIKNQVLDGEVDMLIDYVSDYECRAKLHTELFALGYDVSVIEDSEGKVKSIPKIRVSWYV